MRLCYQHGVAQLVMMDGWMDGWMGGRGGQTLARIFGVYFQKYEGYLANIGGKSKRYPAKSRRRGGRGGPPPLFGKCQDFANFF